jgi:hypothetical protein
MGRCERAAAALGLLLLAQADVPGRDSGAKPDADRIARLIEQLGDDT